MRGSPTQLVSTFDGLAVIARVVGSQERYDTIVEGIAKLRDLTPSEVEDQIWNHLERLRRIVHPIQVQRRTAEILQAGELSAEQKADFEKLLGKYYKEFYCYCEAKLALDQANAGIVLEALLRLKSKK